MSSHTCCFLTAASLPVPPFFSRFLILTFKSLLSALVSSTSRSSSSFARWLASGDAESREREWREEMVVMLVLKAWMASRREEI
jgi:hypothetical protein